MFLLYKRVSLFLFMHAILSYLLPITTVAYAQPKPNILWITIEDTSPQFIGCYGNDAARTPNIDKLAANGIRFTNAFSTNTVCSPSRTTLITGVRTYETGTGHHRSKYRIPDFIKGFPYYMKQAGYYTTNNSKTDYNIFGTPAFTKNAWDESSDKAGWWNRKPGQPFFAVFNFNDSHQSRTMTASYSTYVKEVLEQLPVGSKINDDSFPMPPIYLDSREMRKQMARVYNAIQLTDYKIGKLLQQLEADGLLDSTIIFFFSDHGQGIPRGKTNGIDFGYRVPMVVWFPEMYSHLSPWDRTGVVEELICFEDMAPTMIALAGGKIPAHMKGRVWLGSNRKDSPAYIGLSSDRSDNGIDMVRSVTDGRYMYSRNYMPFMPEVRYINYMEIGEMKQLMRRDWAAGKLNEHQRRLFEPREAEYLFDLKDDPWELKNLSNDPKYRDVLQLMRRRLDSIVLQSRDVMFLPEYELAFISDEKKTPYEYRMDDTQYPISKIYQVASLSGKRGKKVAQQQLNYLKSNHSIIRYWAIVGLRSQPDKILKKHRTALLQALNDSYPPVSVTVAAIAYDLWGDTKAEHILKETILGANEHLALMALNYALYFDSKRSLKAIATEVINNSKANQNVMWAARDYLRSINDYKILNQTD